METESRHRKRPQLLLRRHCHWCLRAAHRVRWSPSKKGRRIHRPLLPGFPSPVDQGKAGPPHSPVPLSCSSSKPWVVECGRSTALLDAASPPSPRQPRAAQRSTVDSIFWARLRCALTFQGALAPLQYVRRKRAGNGNSEASAFLEDRGRDEQSKRSGRRPALPSPHRGPRLGDGVHCSWNRPTFIGDEIDRWRRRCSDTEGHVCCGCPPRPPPPHHHAPCPMCF